MRASDRKTHIHSRHALDSSPSQLQLAVSASNDMTARLWNIAAATAEQPLPWDKCHVGTLTHPNWVYSVSVVRDIAATGCGDGLVRLWSLATHRCLRTLEHSAGTLDNPYLQSPVYSVRMVRGVAISGCKDGYVKVWSLGGDFRCLSTLNHGSNVQGLVLSEDGFIVSSGGKAKKLYVWRPQPRSKGHTP